MLYGASKARRCVIDDDGDKVQQPSGTMGLLKFFLRLISNNAYLLFGIVLGLYLSSNFREFTCSNEPIVFDTAELSPNTTTPKILMKNNNTTKKTKQTKLVRPRYYSTELGIREKLFIGVLSSEEKINTQAVYINRTTAHLVDKVKFFVTAQQNIKNKYNLSGIVGFTGTRQAYRPFQIIKYIGDSFIDYDYYFLMHDHSYLNARALKRIVSKISVSLNVYLGIKVSDGSYCDLSSGILLSNSVLRAMLDHLDWCIRNAVSEDLGENLGRCVHRSLRLNCQDVVQNQNIESYKIKHFELENYLSALSKLERFKKAVTVHPVLQKSDFYLLHAFYSKQQLKKIKAEINELSKGLDGNWPSGQRIGSKPASRFDIAPSLYFNMTHMFFPDDYTNIREHTHADLEDIERVINAITSKVLYTGANDYQFSRLINGYRTFQLSRGLDYQIDLAFRDLHTGREVVKRFEVCKPLGQVEFLSKPYTTENGRVTVLLPIQENELDEANHFINNFVASVLDQRNKVFLMFAFLYQYNTTSKGNDDIYKNLKDVAINLTRKYHSEDTKVAWVSIRLPGGIKGPILLQDFPALNFIVMDLALRKIGVQDLILVLDVYAEVSIEFLNRIKMNTIENFQIFNPIPFRQYNPKISQVQAFDVNKRAGQFDREEYKYVSFYARDYVLARKKYNSTLPIIKSDNDILFALQEAYKKIGNIFEMFVRFSPDLHRMRATDPALKVRYHEETDLTRANLFLGNKVQLAKLEHQDKGKSELTNNPFT